MRKSIKKIIALSISTMSLLATTSISVNAEWRQSPNRLWWYSEGSSWSVGWRFINNQWYYFDSNGYMKTGWLQDTNEKWYYLNSNGDMARNIITPDGYKIGEDGIWTNVNTIITPTTQNDNNIQNSVTKQSSTTSSSNSSNNSSSSSSSNKNLFSVIFKLDDLNIIGMVGGRQSLYGSKINTHGVIVLDARNYNKTRAEIIESDWKKDWHIEKNGDVYKFVSNIDSLNNENSSDYVTIFYYLSNLEIDALCQGKQSMTFYSDVSNPSQTYGMIVVNSKDFNTTSKDIVRHANDYEVKEENGEMKLVKKSINDNPINETTTSSAVSVE